MRRLSVREEVWPLARPFTISRGSRTETRVVVVEIEDEDGRARGRGESVPYPRYDESVEGVLAQIDAVRDDLEAGLDRALLQSRLPPGAARNAVDCALWDLEAKVSGRRAWMLAGLAEPHPVTTAFTISLDTPQAMAAAAREAADRPLLKLKLGGGRDLERVQAVRAAAAKARLIVDANEAMSFEDLTRLAPEFARLGVELIEQPLPAGADEALENYDSPVTLCADESLHTRAELEACARRYGAVNVKLDKTGGLTEALALSREARARGLKLMIGCMVSTSLSIAPASLCAQDAAVVDLDAPLLLAHDRKPGLRIDGSTIAPPDAALWG
ncbi:MAG TPA: N-acetyl-D-Glu racemase DgcA [Caulobacteraceae bacterium]